MAPIEWNQNEINYMDLALKSVAPERFPALTAIFDESAARFVSFGLLGLLADALGLDLALVIGRLANIVAYAAALATLARAWRLSLAEIALGLVVFLVASQNYFAGEWLFSGVEPKTFAYPAESRKRSSGRVAPTRSSRRTSLRPLSKATLKRSSSTAVVPTPSSRTCCCTRARGAVSVVRSI
jgi:hypothetical protein